MTFKKTAVMTVAALMTALSPLTADAQQYRLPASHSQQHESMLALQHPAAALLEKGTKQNLTIDLEEREGLQGEEIFTQYWGSQSVNPYAGAEIPKSATINVMDYVSPLKNIRVSSKFGWRPRFGRMHRGIDLTLNVGDSVMSTFDGKVRLVRYEAGGYGHYVVVRHDNGLETIYAHLSRTLVKPNQRVKAGQVLALGGNTGRSTGPHLHFETRFMGLPINPELIINFENKVPHDATFAFDKASVQRSQYAPKSSKKYYAKSKKSSKKKYTASKSSKSKKKSKKKSRR